AVRTAIDPSGARQCRSRRQGRAARSDVPAAPDRFAPERSATQPAPRQRPLPDAESFGGEVWSLYSITSSAATSKPGGAHGAQCWLLRLLVRVDHVAGPVFRRCEHGLIAHAAPGLEAGALLDVVILHLEEARLCPLPVRAVSPAAHDGLELVLAEIVRDLVVNGALGTTNRFAKHGDVGVAPSPEIIAERIGAFGRGACLVLLEELGSRRQKSREKYIVGTAWRAASAMSWSWCLLKTESAAKVSASTRCWTKLAKAASMSRLLVAFWTMIVSPSARAAACTSVVSDWEAGFFGFTSKPITVALGTSSCSNSSRLGASVLYRKLVPVTLPPGRLRLDTRPSLTASPPIEKTIGMVAVVALAASGAAAFWIATSTATWRRTRSA